MNKKHMWLFKKPLGEVYVTGDNLNEASYKFCRIEHLKTGSSFHFIDGIQIY